VTRHEHRPTFGREAFEEAADPANAVRIQPVHRLVEHEHRRVAQQSSGDSEALCHPEREPARAAARDLGEADEFEHLFDPPARDAVGRSKPA